MSSNVSISGAVSGIDTASLINQLMTVEAQTQTSIKTKQTAAQKAADAYTSLITSIKSLQSQAAAVAKTSAWQGSTATASSTSVTATATGSAQGTLMFDVTAVAAAHTLVSTSTVASTGTRVVSGGTLTVNDADGNSKGTIDVGNGSLSEVVAAINNSGLGLRAAAVQTAPGSYRLQVTSATAGASSAFSLSGVDGFDTSSSTSGMNMLTQGADAELTIGDPSTTGYTVASSSNTFKDLIPGVSFTVSKQEAGVTVDAKVDGSAVADQIKSLVDAANTALASINTQTAYDFTTKTGAALYGENNLKSLQQGILSAVGGASAPGVQLTRDGKLSFDRDAFVKAYRADSTAVAASYGAKSSFTPNTGVLGKAALLAGQTGTRAGNYDVAVSVAAAKEQWSVPTPASLGGQTFVITQGSLTASYTVGAGEGISDVLAAVNSRAAAAGIGVSVSTSGGSIVFGATSAGTASAFSVEMDATPGTQVRAGRDVAGTIDGEEATGTGNILALTSTTSGANGLSLIADFSDADVSASGGAVGSISYSPGLAQRLSTLLNDAVSSDGSLTRAKQSRVGDVKDLQDQIDDWDIRLAARRETLTKQFTAMETAIAALKSQSSSISGLLSSSTTTSSR
jgi:flagellar hook-associated protein 2